VIQFLTIFPSNDHDSLLVIYYFHSPHVFVLFFLFLYSSKSQGLYKRSLDVIWTSKCEQIDIEGNINEPNN